VADAIRAGSPGLPVEVDDRLQLLAPGRLVARFPVQRCELEARLHQGPERLGEALDVGAMGLDRADQIARVLVELGSQEQRLALQLLLVGLAGNPLVLLSGPEKIALFPVDERHLLRRLAVQLVLRVRRAERLEHRGGTGPILQTDQLRAGVVLGNRPDVGAGGRLGDA
jgi:hypothetical protein